MTEGCYDGIAIIGMAGRFPGAESIEELWANLLAGTVSMSFFDDGELAESGLDGSALRRQGHYIAARGVLKEADCFDAAFFGIHPKEAEVLDPQHRLFLEICWAALERAGYAPNRIRETVGVFAGATFNTYLTHALYPRPDLMNLVGSDLVMFGNEKDYLTTRVAYKLGLRGPAVNVSTACSTSLVAVAQACQSLLTFQCDMALAGGSSITLPQKRGYFHDEGNIGSADGLTRTFDAQSSGTAFSNGVAVVVLKRLGEAIADGDQIYAVIKGAAVNNDGAQRVSFGAPGVEGQSEVIAMAQALAGVQPETITYLEAHGTATPLGDPIEIAGLTKAFRLGTQAKQFCAIGSVKSNLGHLDVAAGVTGLIKTALSVHYGILPASQHFTAPNPALDLENSPFFVNSTRRVWTTAPGIPRRAGVSSFGTGGTNAHVVLEEAPEIQCSGASRPQQLLVLSAKSVEALDRATANLCRHLRQLPSTGADAARELADAAFTLQTGRSEFAHRRIVVGRDAAEAAAALELGDARRVFTERQEGRHPPIVFMFPGQGAQYPGMGAELYRTEPVFREEVDRCAEVVQPILQEDLRALLFPRGVDRESAGETLQQTRITQPTLFTIEYALAKLWMSWGIRPASMIGHSVGEYVAGCLADVLTLEDALILVAKRGALVQAQAGGAMLAVRLAERDLVPLLSDQLAIAAVNSPALSVVAGPYDQIALLEQQLTAQGVVSRHLHTSHAFHSPMMDPVLAPFTELVKCVRLGEPKIPYVSNVTANWITAREAQSAEYWASHVRSTVRFADGLGELMKEPRNVLLEIGPGQTLTTLARQHPSKSASQLVLASLPLAGEDEPRGILEALGRLWLAGSDIDWHGFYANERRRHVVLPAYPFERKRHWPQSTKTEGAPQIVPAVDPATPGPAQPEPAPAVQAVAKKVSRLDRLNAEARALLQDLSGSDFSEVDSSADLLELGLDSLLLTQAATLFQRRFGVHITFRQLMEDLRSVETIALHLDAQLPPEAEAPVIASQPASLAPPPAQSVPAGVLEQLLQQQQQLTKQLLDLLGKGGAAPVPLPPPQVSQPAAVPSVRHSESRGHGPFRPLDRGTGNTLSPLQSQALARLIERYTRRTAESKRLAAANRALLADPRSVSGFKQAWKEMVYPLATTRSDGSKVWDVDGNEYVDFVMGFGASLFGHRPSFVVKAVQEQLERGFEIGPIQPLAGEVAALLRELTGMERFAFTNTGSEAVLAATRVSRVITGRDKIVMFAGAYHGIFDEVLYRPVTRNGEPHAAPLAPGIPESALGHVVVLEYGTAQAIEYLRRRGNEFAAVLVEPVQSRRLDFQPADFLRELRSVTEQTGTALIFDEVVTGFRVAPGGTQELFGIRADLATYGKVIGGGLPIGVVSGSPKYLDALDGGAWQYGDASFPEVGVTFFAGTFVRHPLALAAAKAVLSHLKEKGPELQQQLTQRTQKLAGELRAILAELDVPYQLTQFCSLMHLTHPSDQKTASLLYYLLRERGIHMWENRVFVVTTAHDESDFAKLSSAFRESLIELQANELLPAPSRPSAPPPAAMTESGKLDSHEPIPVGAFPLTAAQSEIWLAAQMGGEAAVAYNESLKLEFRGEFDDEAFRAAALRVVERHPILLARLGDEGQWQCLNPDARFELPLADLSSAADAESGLEQIIEHEVSEPFDLVQGPLLRVRIVKMSAHRWVVVWTAHHIVCDGWSGGLIVSELAKIYSALKEGKQPDLEDSIPFRDYALAAQGGDAEVQRSVGYWSEQFTSLPAPLELPTDRIRPPVRTARASTVRRALDTSTQRSIKRVAGQLRTTQVVLLLAGLKALLYRLTGQSDVAVGLGAAGQALSGKHCMVGHCLNLLPIRTLLDGDASFQDNLTAVKKAVLDGYDHHHCTLGSILEHVRVPRRLDRPPLIEVLFNVDRDPADVQFHGVDFTCERNPKRALHFDLFVNVVDGPTGLSVECDYNADLFDAETIERWLGNYETLLQSVALHPMELLGQVPLLTDDERRTLVSWNETEVKVPYDNVIEWFGHQAQERRDQVAVTFNGTDLTYGDLDQRSNQLARHLRALGVGPDVLVGLLLERSLDMVVALLGVMKAGGAYVPLDPAFPRDRLVDMIEDSGMPLMVTHSAVELELPVRPAKVVHLDDDRKEIERQSEAPMGAVDLDPERLAYVLYTSGSTGKPKGVEIPQSALVNFLFSMQKEPGFAAKDTLLAVTTLSFDIAGLEIYLPLVSGGRVVIASRDDARDPGLLMKLMSSYYCTVMQATPATWQALVDAGWEGSRDLKLLCGGESFPRRLADKLLPRCAELWNVYGPTETTIWSTVHHVELAERAIPIGRPIANTQVFVLDGKRNLVPEGVLGELYIGGRGLARGYHRRPDLTRDRFVPSPFEQGGRLYRTGDTARWLRTGQLECLGRIDGQVKIRGFRIELGEIEAVLSHHESVGRTVVVAHEDASGDKRLVAYLETEGRPAPEFGRLRTYLKSKLPDYMIPSTFVAVTQFPLTPNGKIDRKALPTPDPAPIEIRESYVPPRDPLEVKLAAIWSRVLNVPRLGIHDNFFELGGHSLRAVVLLSEIRKFTGKSLPLATLFHATTVAEMAALLRQEGWTPSWSALVPIQATGSKRPLFLVHGAEGNVLLYRALTQQLGPDQPVYGLQSFGLDGSRVVEISVEQMASTYLKEVMSLQPRGPYLLGGYCLGGTIAYEMAQQLRKLGQDVELVVMLDTYNDSSVSRAGVRLLSPLHFLQNLWFHAANALSVRPHDRQEFLREKLDIELTRWKVWCGATLRRFGRSASRDISYAHLDVKRTNDKAAAAYLPRPYDGRVAVIRSKGHFAGFSSPSLGWDALVNEGLEVHELSVYPKGMLVEPFSRQLSEKLRACLALSTRARDERTQMIA